MLLSRSLAFCLFLAVSINPVAQAQTCTIETFAGPEMGLSRPGQLYEGPDGSIYIADRGTKKVFRVEPGGAVSSVYEGDVRDFAVDASGNLFVTEGRWIDKITPGGEKARFVDGQTFGYVGIEGLDIDHGGNVYALVEWRNSIWFVVKVNPEGILEAPGTQVEGQVIGIDPGGRIHVPFRNWVVLDPDGGVSQESSLNGFATFPLAFAVAADGATYVVNSLTGAHGVGRFRSGLVYDTIAGGLDAGFSGDGGPAADAKLDTVRGLTLSRDGDLYISDWLNSRVRRIRGVSACPSQGPRPLPALSPTTNAASYSYLAPGSVFTMFGVRLGPPDLITATLDSQNSLPTELAGTRVFFDGTPAPLLYVSGNQLGGVVPFGTRLSRDINEYGGPIGTDPPNRVVVQSTAGSSDEREILILPASPGVFTLDASGQGPAAALNQDGTLNTANNPAHVGEVFVIWATGFGAVEPTPLDGAVLNDVLPKPIQSVDVTLSGEPTELLYAAAAPGMVAGVMQINARILPSQQLVGPVQITVKVGNVSSQQYQLTLFIAE